MLNAADDGVSSGKKKKKGCSSPNVPVHYVVPTLSFMVFLAKYVILATSFWGQYVILAIYSGPGISFLHLINE